MEFSTSDADHDKTGGNCAKAQKCGWWFNKGVDCAAVNLNGDWEGMTKRGIFWDNKGNTKSPTKDWDKLKFTKIFIGPSKLKQYPCLLN